VLRLVSFNGKQVHVLNVVGHCVADRAGNTFCLWWKGSLDVQDVGRVGRRTIISSWLEFCITFAWNEKARVSGSSSEGAHGLMEGLLTIFACFELKW
jgi:hypothetical protein